MRSVWRSVDNWWQRATGEKEILFFIDVNNFLTNNVYPSPGLVLSCTSVPRPGLTPSPPWPWSTGLWEQGWQGRAGEAAWWPWCPRTSWPPSSPTSSTTTTSLSTWTSPGWPLRYLPPNLGLEQVLSNFDHEMIFHTVLYFCTRHCFYDFYK